MGEKTVEIERSDKKEGLKSALLHSSVEETRRNIRQKKGVNISSK